MVSRPSVLLIEKMGLEGNYHCGGSRQVSLVASEALEALSHLEGTGLCLEKYAANLITKDLDYSLLRPGDRLVAGSAVLELTEVGKPCHYECALFQQKSVCPLTTMSAFAVVVTGGRIQTGDLLRVE
jgi:MOSC domain-containing protein YiiM